MKPHQPGKFNQYNQKWIYNKKALFPPLKPPSNPPQNRYNSIIVKLVIHGAKYRLFLLITHWIYNNFSGLTKSWQSYPKNLQKPPDRVTIFLFRVTRVTRFSYPQ